MGEEEGDSSEGPGADPAWLKKIAAVGEKFSDEELGKLQFQAEPREKCLERYLVARKGDIAAAQVMMRNALEFRPFAEKCVADGKSACLGADEEEVAQFYRGGYAGFCKDGRPVWYEQPGRIDVHSLLCLTTDENFIRYHVCLMEELQVKYAESTAAQGRTINKTLSILDLEGLSLGMLGSETLGFVKKLAKIDSDNYPETMGKMLLINTPAIFQIGWGVISPMLDPRTVSKIELLQGPEEWKPRLAELVAQDQVPAELGGTGPACLSTHKVFEEKSLASGEEARIELAVKSGNQCNYKFFTLDGANISFKVIFVASEGSGEIALIPARDYPPEECSNGKNVCGQVVAPGDGVLAAVWEHQGWVYTRKVMARFNLQSDGISELTDAVGNLGVKGK